jgi:hypothetical protein
VGQLSGSGAVFLSAGVPDPEAAHFVRDGDSAAIVAAVSAVLYVTLGRRRLVWGGHPAITPMVWSVAEAMGIEYGEWVTLYQSLRFEDEFPEETAKFQNVVFTEAVGTDIPASLAVMRARMIQDTQYDAAVFIGGMAGILEEFDLIRAAPQGIKTIPVASTGGAAGLLFEQTGADPSLAAELDYVALFHQQLEIDPNELRYRSPAQQPADVSERIRFPGR